MLDDARVGPCRVGRHPPRPGRKADHRNVGVGHGRAAQRAVQGRARRRAETAAGIVRKIPVADLNVAIRGRYARADPTIRLA